MIECTVTERSGISWLQVRGRIDSMTCEEIQAELDGLVERGTHKIVVDLEGVNYVSSAGMRVFISTQKMLERAGGEIFLYRPSGNVLSVFELSGFNRLFRLISTEDEILSILNSPGPVPGAISRKIGNMDLEILEKDSGRGGMTVIGSQERLSSAGYGKEDVRTIDSSRIRFGTGLAAFGDSYEAFSDYFGEAVVLNRHFYYYPAVKRPAVDYILCNDEKTAIDYRFFYGFGFMGEYRYIVSFLAGEEFVSLGKITDALFEISDAQVLGIVLLAESKGFWGMNLKKVPARKNRTQDSIDIFDQSLFPEWINFPVEPSCINNLIAGCGIAVRDRDSLSMDIRSVLSQDGNIHMHAGVFEKGVFNRGVANFENELDRVIKGLDVFSVQHVLPKSLFGHGTVGIVEIDT